MRETSPPEPPISEEEKDYFRGVEERFCALRGAARLLSPRDWALIASWWSERVPLRLVLECLEEVFATRARRGEPKESVASLAYVKPEIQRRFRLHRELVALRRGDEEESGRLRREIHAHLGRLARRLCEAAESTREQGQEALPRALLTTCAEVRRVRRDATRRGWSLSEAEARLEQLQSELMDIARAAAGETGRKVLQSRAREILADRAALMTRQAYRETLHALEENLLRQVWGIPRVSLLGEG